MPILGPKPRGSGEAISTGASSSCAAGTQEENLPAKKREENKVGRRLLQGSYSLRASHNTKKQLWQQLNTTTMAPAREARAGGAATTSSAETSSSCLTTTDNVVKKNIFKEGNNQDAEMDNGKDASQGKQGGHQEQTDEMRYGSRTAEEPRR